MSLAPLADAVLAHLVAAPDARLKLVALTGSVAVGKSTLARALAPLLAVRVGAEVPVLSTDGFLHADAALTRAGLLGRKGFPETFDRARLMTCLSAVADGERVEVPVYDHGARGVVGAHAIGPTRWLIVEGVFAVQPCRALDVPCCAIFVTGDLDDIEARYVARARALREGRGRRASAEAERAARATFRSINLVNLTEHIAPLRDTCDLVVEQRTGQTARLLAC